MIVLQWSVNAAQTNNRAHWIQAPFTPAYLQNSHLYSAYPHHSSASSQHSLFIFGHTRSSIYIIFSSNISTMISFLPLCFFSSLESAPGFPPSTTHWSLQFWRTQSFEWHFLHRFHRLTTLIIHHPSLFHSRLKTFLFSKPFPPLPSFPGFRTDVSYRIVSNGAI